MAHGVDRNVEKNNMTERLKNTETIQNGDYKEIIESLNKHESYRAKCLNMIASENAMSPATRTILSSDLGNRYSVGPYERWFPGLEEYTKIEKKAIDLTKELLPGADYVTVQPVSGMNANQVAYRALINRGDLVFVVEEKHGGHYSHRKGEDFLGDNGKNSKAISLLEEYGANVDYLPFDEEKYNIDSESSVEKILKDKPNLIIVGASEMLFPAPLKELRKAADQVGAVILYDAAHVFGLILGGEFQNPLVEGAHIVATSTNKTMGGPDHGLIAWTGELQEKLKLDKLIGTSLVPFYTSNHHSHHVAGVAVTLAELKVFGKDYARQVIKNAKVLGAALNKYGVKVLGENMGFSESHEVLIDIEEASNNSNIDEASRLGNQAKLDLAKANIIVSRCPIPSSLTVGHDGEPNTGLRLGTNEMTRMGMDEMQMIQIAEYVADVLKHRKTPEEVKIEVEKFRLNYQTQRYCFPLPTKS